MHFIHFLAECEGKIIIIMIMFINNRFPTDDPSNTDFRLSDVLAFFSGAEKIFTQKPTLEFSSTNPYQWRLHVP